MRKIFSHTNIVFLILILFVIVSSSVLLSIPDQKIGEIRSKAAGNTLTVCPESSAGCSFVGGDGIQQAVDAAQNGDTILLQPGRYTRRNPTVDPQIKYRNCMVNARAKTLTIKGPGALLDGENYGVDKDSSTWVIGICSQGGGEVTIDSLQIKQTLRPAIFIRSANAIIKNVTFIDIDNTVIDIWAGSKVVIVNNISLGSAGPGINVLPLSGVASAVIKNNIFFGNGGAGISFRLCDTSQPDSVVENNIIVTDPSSVGIQLGCPEQTQKIAAIKSANNIIWKGKRGDCSAMDDDITGQAACAPGELCDGTTLANPNFNGADERGSVCVWGEGITAGDLHTRPGSPAAGAGAYTGVCADGNSSACLSYIEQLKSQFQPPALPTDIFPTSAPFIPPDTNPPPDNSTPNPSQPTRPPSDDSGPPITYYLPPTMSFENPNQPTSSPSDNNPPTTGEENPPTPTITPTPKPLIDIGKTVENAKTGISNLWNSFINFTKTVLP